MTPNEAHPTLDRARDDFVRQRLELVRTHGPEAFDQAHVLYLCPSCGHAVVVRDGFYGSRPEGPFPAFLARLTGGWWQARQRLQAACTKCGAEGPLPAAAGFYAHYLGEVGFDYGVELRPAGVERCWRMDARARVAFLRVPADEGDFRDQTGTFFDLRAGWRWLLGKHHEHGALVLAEVQTGYVIGVRHGVPGEDPAERYDPELEEAAAAWSGAEFDVLEFLAGEQAEGYPFHGERYAEWLGEGAGEIDAGRTELFVLADSSQFLEAIEDMAARRGIAVEWVDPEENLKVAFHHGDLRLEASFAYPLLRSLHTGRTFVDGSRAFYLPLLDALDDAHDLIETVRAEIDEAYEVGVEDGTVLVIRGPDGEVGRWNLMAVVGRQSFRGAEGTGTLLRFLGYDREAGRFMPRGAALDACPACGQPARVGKVIRPLDLLGVDPRMLVGMPIGQHLVYYTLECPLHATPVEPGPGRDLAALEAAYRAGLDEATGTLIEARSIELPGEAEAWLLVGFDAGSLVLEPSRLRAALAAAGLPDEGERYVYAFFPDALVVSEGALDGPARHAARLTAMEAVLPRFPARSWPLDVARPVKLLEPARGRFEVVA
jgi:hypothetical protein